MSDLKVSFGALAGASADIAGGATQLESTLADLDRSLQPLRANWSGEAAASYETAKARWTSAINDMKGLLAEIGTTVGTSGQDYEAAEKKNAARW